MTVRLKRRPVLIATFPRHSVQHLKASIHKMRPVLENNVWFYDMTQHRDIHQLPQVTNRSIFKNSFLSRLLVDSLSHKVVASSFRLISG